MTRISKDIADSIKGFEAHKAAMQADYTDEAIELWRQDHEGEVQWSVLCWVAEQPDYQSVYGEDDEHYMELPPLKDRLDDAGRVWEYDYWSVSEYLRYSVEANDEEVSDYISELSSQWRKGNFIL